MSIFHGTREWIYTKNVGGTYQRLHRFSGLALIGFLFVVPWISVGGHPAVQADIPARRFYLLGEVYTASDFFLAVLGALLAAFSLFLASALLGRLWCGYLCPQTVFLEEWVRRVEAWFEGDGSVRQRRALGGWTWDRLWRRAGTVGTLTLLAAALGLTVVSWFVGAHVIWTGAASSTAYTLAGIIMVGALADWLWFREQLCIYLCPYARFQSVLADDYSLTVSYDASVPVVAGKAGAKNACIDCRKCVTVCPQGIDIRDGFQLECINCARCVDACTDVMEKLDRPSLVTYTTIAKQEGRKQRTLRPRVLVYSALVTGLATALVAGLVLHQPVEVSVQRAPGTLYQLDEDAVVRNTFLIRVVNNSVGEPRRFEVSVEGLDGAQVDVPPVELAAEEARTIPLVVRAPRATTATTVPIVVTIHGGDRPVIVHTTFKSPGDS